MRLRAGHNGARAEPPPIGEHKPITSEAGDARFAEAMAGRGYTDAPVRPLGGRIARPEPAIANYRSSLWGNPGSSGGQRGVRGPVNR